MENRFDLKAVVCLVRHGDHLVDYDNNDENFNWACRYCGSVFIPGGIPPNFPVVYFNTQTLKKFRKRLREGTSDWEMDEGKG